MSSCGILFCYVILFTLVLLAMVRGGRVVRCRTRSWVRIPPVAAVHQRQLSVPSPPGSVNEYQRKLGSKRAYHSMSHPRIRGLAASAGVLLRANDTEISAAPWALELGKGLYLLLYCVNAATHTSELVGN